VVDEFGRDVKDKESMARSKRRDMRRRVRLEARERRKYATITANDAANCNADAGSNASTDNETNTIYEQERADYQDSDLDATDEELMEWEERRMALSDAIQILLDELDQKYTSTSDLISLFRRWFETYPDDYRRCYASLSLVDLVDVFVRIDLCREGCLDFTAGCFDTTDTERISTGDGWSRRNISKKFSWFGELEELDRHVMMVSADASGKGHNDGGMAVDGSEDENEHERTLDLLIQKMCQRIFHFPPLDHDPTSPSTNKRRSYDDDDDDDGDNGTKKGCSMLDFNPTSAKQSRAISSFYRSLVLHSDRRGTQQTSRSNNDNDARIFNGMKISTTMKLTQREFGTNVLNYLKHFLDAIAIPILRRHVVVHEILEYASPTTTFSTTVTGNYDEECLDAITFATFGQMHRLTKLASNVCTFWYPLMKDHERDEEANIIRLAEKFTNFCLLDVVASRLLPILSSLEASSSDIEANNDGKHVRFIDSGCRKEIRTAFAFVFESIKKVGWFDRADLMLQTAPIRAAASKYMDHI